MPAVRVIGVNNLRIPADYDPKTTGISQSLLGTFQTCRRAFLFKVNRWQERTSDRAFGFGTLTHAVLDAIYTAALKGTAYEDLWPVALKAINDHQISSAFTVDEQEKMKAISEALMQNYLIHYRKDFVEMRFEALEEEFAIKWHGFILRGKKDGRFRDKTGGLWNIEHKAYSRISENMPLMLSFDLQNLFYMLSDMIIHKKLLSGVLYNVLRKPDVRKQMPMGEVRGYLDDLIRKDPGHYFIRYEVPYNKSDLDMFQKELLVKLREMGGLLKMVARWPGVTLDRFWKNECACEGKYTCDYLQACASGHLSGGYIQKTTIFPELPNAAKIGQNNPGQPEPDPVQALPDPAASAQE